MIHPDSFQKAHNLLELYQHTGNWYTLDSVGLPIWQSFCKAKSISEESITKLRKLEVSILKYAGTNRVVRYIQDLYTKQYLQNFKKNKDERVLHAFEEALNERYHQLSPLADQERLEILKTSLLEMGLAKDSRLLKYLNYLTNSKQLNISNIHENLFRTISLFLNPTDLLHLASVDKRIRQILYYPQILQLERLSDDNLPFLIEHSQALPWIRKFKATQYNFVSFPVMNVFNHLETLILDQSSALSLANQGTAPFLSKIKCIELTSCENNNDIEISTLFEFLGKNCSELKEFSITNWTVTPKSFDSIRLLFSKIVKLKIIHATIPNYEEFTQYLKFFENCFPKIEEYTEENIGLTPFISLLPNVKKLALVTKLYKEYFNANSRYPEFAHINNFWNENFIITLENVIKNVKVLNLSIFESTENIFGNYFTEKKISAIANNCQNLESLSLEGSPFSMDLNDSRLMPLFSALENIKNLTLVQIYITGACFESFGKKHRPKLENVVIRDSRLNDNGLANLVNALTHVESLELINHKITHKGYALLGKFCKHLRQLKCSWGKVNNEFIKELAPALPFVQELDFQNSHIGNDGFVALAKHCKMLKTMNLHNSHLDDEDLIVLAPALQGIVNLDISENKKITGACLSALVKCFNKLQKLNLKDLHGLIESNFIEIIPALHKLKWIAIPDHFSEETTLNLLKTCPSLEYVEGPFNPVKSRDNIISFREELLRKFDPAKKPKYEET